MARLEELQPRWFRETRGAEHDECCGEAPTPRPLWSTENHRTVQRYDLLVAAVQRTIGDSLLPIARVSLPSSVGGLFGNQCGALTAAPGGLYPRPVRRIHWARSRCGGRRTKYPYFAEPREKLRRAESADPLKPNENAGRPAEQGNPKVR